MQALRHLIIPVNYWRTVEFGFTYKNLNIQDSDKILDIGSPKLLSLYLAKKYEVDVHATDIEDYFIRPFSKLREIEKIDPKKYLLQVEDGCGLSFENDKFDKIYSISVIEHIPEMGDTDCVKQISRVLKPGGKCVITVPFAPESKTEYRNPDFYWAKNSTKGPGDKVFFQRRYSEADIHNRLIGPSGLKCKKLVYVGEKIFRNSGKEFCNYLPAFTGPIQPILSKLFLSKESNDWRKVQNPLCALLVF